MKKIICFLLWLLLLVPVVMFSKSVPNKIKQETDNIDYVTEYSNDIVYVTHKDSITNKEGEKDYYVTFSLNSSSITSINGTSVLNRNIVKSIKLDELDYNKLKSGDEFEAETELVRATNINTVNNYIYTDIDFYYNKFTYNNPYIETAKMSIKNDYNAELLATYGLGFGILVGLWLCAGFAIIVVHEMFNNRGLTK